MHSFPSNWQVKSLDEVVKISKGKKLNSLVDKETSISKRFIQIDDLRNSDYLKFTEDESGLLVNEKDVLIAWDGANAGTVGFGLDGYIGSTIARLEILVENISTNYFGWFLRTKSKHLRDNCTGATIPHVNKAVLGAIKIPLPPLPIQKHIAEILEKADQAKRKRKEANKLTDEFLQSVFIEMFGHQQRKSKGITIKKLAEITTQITDGVHAKPTYVKVGIPFISVKDITTGKLIFDKVKYISEAEHRAFIKRCKPEFLDILYTKVGATYGRPALVDTNKEFSIYVSVALIKPNHSIVDPYYLRFALQSESVKLQADKRIKGIGVPDLHLVEIKSFDIIVPPLSLQQQFAEIVNKTEALKEKQKQSEQELENLFQSLMQKAFKGELVLN